MYYPVKHAAALCLLEHPARSIDAAGAVQYGMFRVAGIIFFCVPVCDRVGYAAAFALLKK